LNFKFSKRVLQNYTHPANGYFKSCSVYAVHSSEEIIGTFLLGEKAAFIDFEQASLRIDISRHVFKSDKYEIVDRVSEIRVGEYKIPLDLAGTTKPGTLLLNGKGYACKKLKPDVRYSPLKKSTWGHFKVMVFDKDEEVVYKLKLNVPIINVPDTTQRPFDGEIQANTNNLRLLFCGLFLLEQAFEIKDNQMT
jgi:hypothetical protein